MSDEYKPISCELHTQYELWIMREQEIRLVWQDVDDLSHVEKVKPLDVLAETGNEYLYFEDTLSRVKRIRLDYIYSAEPI